MAREAQEFGEDIRSLPVCSQAPAAVVRKAVESAFNFKEPMSLEDAASRVARLLREHAVHVTHPRYFGLFNPSVTLASIIGDTLTALYNPQMSAWSHAPAANEMERVVLRHFARALGYDAEASHANFTSGGLEANLSAVLVALARRFPGYERGGLRAVDTQPIIYVTSESHHSFVKICRSTGLGLDALREVPTDARFAMDTRALQGVIEADRASGRCPLVIVATAGTTGGGIVDPIVALADIAAQSGAWLHVDAAWGGAAALVPRLRPVLRGIERSDSVTWDAHKWLSVPMGAGMFFSRHAEDVRRAFDVSTSYMPAAQSQAIDPYRATLQWSRRAIGLKVLMTLAAQGSDGLAAQVDHQARIGDALRAKLLRAGWTIANDTVLPLVCFTHENIRSGARDCGAIVRFIQGRGKAWISEVVLGGRERVLRACITSYRTDEADLDVLMSELTAALAAA